MLCFWSKLVSSEKLSSKIYNLTYNLYKNGTNGLKWIDFIKKTFDEIGLSFIFTNQLEINPNWIKVHATSRGHFYSIFKQGFCMEPYLTRLTEVHRKFITKLRVNNIKFPIETGRWRNINRKDIICQKCSISLIGDEFHYLFVCNCHDILELRNKYIPNYFTTNAKKCLECYLYAM